MSGRMSTFALALIAIYFGGMIAGAQQPGSHVLRFGNLSLAKNHLAFFMGGSRKFLEDNEVSLVGNEATGRRVEQRDADLVHFERLANHPNLEKRNNGPLREATEHRLMVDNAVGRIGRLLFGDQHSVVANSVRPPTKALVDDWNCLKSMVAIFERRCGRLKQYGMKHMRAFANFCNARVGLSRMDEVAKITCQLENPLA